MSITYQNTKTGRKVRVLTPEERAANSPVPDRTRRRQRKLIANMDESQRWERVAAQPDPEVRNPEPATPPAEPVEADAKTAPATKPAPTKSGEQGAGGGSGQSSTTEGPKFTRVATTQSKPTSGGK